MKSNSSVSKLSLIRMKKNPGMWILFIVCIYIVVAYFFDEIKIPSFFSKETVGNINLVAFSLSCSYIAAMVFYIISDFSPETRKARTVLANAVEDLRLFKDDFSELSRLIWGDDWLINEDAKESVFRAITTIDYTENADQVIVLPDDMVLMFKDFVFKCDSYLSSIMSCGAYFSSKEYEKISEVRMSFVFSQVRIHFYATESICYNNMTLMLFIDDLIDVNKKVVELYDELLPYGFDFQK